VAIRIIISVDDRKVRRALERVSKAGRSLRKPLGRTALFIIRFAARLLRARNSGWGPMTGKLAKSLTMRLDELSVVVGSNLAYAAIQQLGGTVEPKGHKYLALPVLPALRRGGVWPRDLPRGSMQFAIADIRIGSHAWRGPALVRVEGTGNREQGTGTEEGARGRTKRRAGEVMFALIRRANIKGREYLVFGPDARGFLLADLKREYQKAVKG
jgi:phage gpG-like protein